MQFHRLVYCACCDTVGRSALNGPLLERHSQSRFARISQHQRPLLRPILSSSWTTVKIRSTILASITGMLAPQHSQVPCGIVPATDEDLALATTTAAVSQGVSSGGGVVVSSRLISGLKAGEAGKVIHDVTRMVCVMVAPDIAAAEQRSHRADLLQMASCKNMSLNGIDFLTIPL